MIIARSPGGCMAAIARPASAGVSAAIEEQPEQ